MRCPGRRGRLLSFDGPQFGAVRGDKWLDIGTAPSVVADESVHATQRVLPALEDPVFLGLELRFGQSSGIPQRCQRFELFQFDSLVAVRIRRE